MTNQNATPEVSMPGPMDTLFQRSPDAPTIFVEGISQVAVGFPNSRIVFHSLAIPATAHSPEIRQVGCELIIPTSALFESLTSLLAHLSLNREGFIEETKAWAEKTTAILNTSLGGPAPK